MPSPHERPPKREREVRPPDEGPAYGVLLHITNYLLKIIEPMKSLEISPFWTYGLFLTTTISPKSAQYKQLTYEGPTM